MRSYFGNKTKGLNSDIERHRLKEADLTARITQLEAITERDDFEEHALRSYRYLLGQLQQSKAEVTSKIGRKN